MGSDTAVEPTIWACQRWQDVKRLLRGVVRPEKRARPQDACRAIWREVTGRPPWRFPMPRWLFERFVGTDETTMWRWLGANKVDFDTRPTLAIHPGALTVREWLERKQAPSIRRRQGRASA
jgi:hypothetical protein